MTHNPFLTISKTSLDEIDKFLWYFQIYTTLKKELDIGDYPYTRFSQSLINGVYGKSNLNKWLISDENYEEGFC